VNFIIQMRLAVCYREGVALARNVTFKTPVKAERTLEPGLLRAFRVFNLAEYASLLAVIAAPLLPGNERYTTLIPGASSTLFFVSLFVLEILKLTYLLWPNLPKQLGTLYLPMGIVVTVLSPLARVLFILTSNPEWFYQAFPREGLLGYFLIPLIFVAWQYGFKSILLYILFLMPLELAIYLRLLEFESSLLPLLQGSTIRLIIYLIIGYLITHLVAGQRKQRDELAKANAQLLQYSHTLEQLAESRERNRLARELHDTLAHYMSGTILQLNGAKAIWEKDNLKSKSMLSNAVQTLSEGLDETRKAIQTLRKSPIETLGLTESLKDLAKQYADKLGLELRLEVESISYTPDKVGQTLYPIAQEVFRNIERHASAKSLTVILKQQQQHLLLVIEDDGKGFDAATVNKTKHFGLLGLEERATLLDGDVSIHSRPGQGTRVEVRLPVEPL
jgi:signal transduction histidine kinase